MKPVSSPLYEPARYTLDEAARILALRECNAAGHSTEVIVACGDSRPHRLACRRCGASWRLLDRDASDELAEVAARLRGLAASPAGVDGVLADAAADAIERALLR